MVKIINGVPTRMLDVVFWKSGNLYVRVAEGEKYFVYEVISMPKPDAIPDIKDMAMPKDGDTGNYEIIVKRIVPKSTLDESTEYEQIEKYPSNEEWGIYAWTYVEWSNIKRAIQKKFFEKMSNDEPTHEQARILEDMTLYN